jgi:MFS transporter, BCD family, chlorophyll transporter
LCVLGVALAPMAVFMLPENFFLGLVLCGLTFGAWGMGYNLASVAYLSLAAELSGKEGRSRTIALMWFMMIIGIIFTAATLGQLLENYTHETLERAFQYVGIAAFVFGIIGLLGLEPRHDSSASTETQERIGWKIQIQTLLANRAARFFFLYLIIMLTAILGQDVLLEPYAGQAFGLPVAATTRITSIWGVCVLLTLGVAGWLDRRIDKRNVARLGGWTAISGLSAIALSGLIQQVTVFYGGVVLLGLGTGLATVSNLSLMLDMTTAQVGLYMGAWGVSSAFARLFGSVLSGMARDVLTWLLQNPIIGYVTVFFIQAALLLVSLFMLSRIDVQRFQKQSQNVAERATLLNEVS